MFRNKLFELVQSRKFDYSMFLEIVELHEKAQKKDLQDFCERLWQEHSQLISIVNNAGWKEKHSETIDSINMIMRTLEGVIDDE